MIHSRSSIRDQNVVRIASFFFSFIICIPGGPSNYSACLTWIIFLYAWFNLSFTLSAVTASVSDVCFRKGSDGWIH